VNSPHLHYALLYCSLDAVNGNRDYRRLTRDRIVALDREIVERCFHEKLEAIEVYRALWFGSPNAQSLDNERRKNYVIDLIDSYLQERS
jgi:hypothetical protein